MSKQIKNELLKALLEAANTAERAGDFYLADQSDILAHRTAQLIKNVAVPTLKYLGNDQAAGAIMAPVGNALSGKGLSFDDALTDTPSTMLGVGSGNYVQSYLATPSAWLMDLIPATNKLRFMNMIRSELISSGFTELKDNNIWKAFSEQKGQNGLEAMVREFSHQSERLLGPVKNSADAESRLSKIGQWIKNWPSNRIIGLRQFAIRNFGSLAPSKGGYNTATGRAKLATEYIQSKINSTDEALSTQEFIKKNRLNIDDHGFDRTKLNTKATSPKTPLKGTSSIVGKLSSGKDAVATVVKNLKNNPAALEKAMVSAGKTEEGAKWIRLLKNTKDSTKVAKGLNILGKIAVVIAVADIISTLPEAVRGDARAQADVAINTAGLLFPPLAIANALTNLFGLDLSDMLVTNAEALGESMSGVDMGQTREDLINADMTYNPQTKEWEGKGVTRAVNPSTGKSFESDMINMVKSGMSINQAWAITLKKMKAYGATPEAIFSARQKYNQAKTMIYNDGMIGSIKVPMWSEEQISQFEKSLNKHLEAKLRSGIPYSDLLQEITVYMRKVPNLHMLSSIRSRVVDNLDSVQNSIVNGSKSNTSNVNPQQKINNSLMSRELRSRGLRVAAWQQFLAKNGFFENYTSKTPPVFGPRTTRATKAFQSKYNLRVDGIAGPETLGKARQLGGKL